MKSDYTGLSKSNKYLCLSGCPATLLRSKNKEDFGFIPIIQDDIRISTQQQQEVYEAYTSGEYALGSQSLILIGCTNLLSGQKMAINMAIKFIEETQNPLPFVKWVHLGYKDWSYFQDKSIKHGVVVIPDIEKFIDQDRLQTAKDYIVSSTGSTVIVVAQLMTDNKGNLMVTDDGKFDNTLKLAHRLGIHPDVVIQLGNITKSRTKI